ncbi:MAG: dipeptide epimerase [marine bacterium B5-7]|nr:MAG: dipeptide epimerase [marine bacterium B5-7]
MEIRDLTIENLEIPFRQEFQHASSKRVVTESVLVTARTHDGLTGLGEGCPRDYVTGETLTSVHEFFNRYRPELLKVDQVEELISWTNFHREEIDCNPAAYCAMESALLNIFALSTHQSIENILSVPDLAGDFHYSAVLGARSPTQFNEQLRQYSALCFKDYKIKLFGDLQTDRTNLVAFMDVIGNDVRVRFDANNIWASANDAVEFLRLLDVVAFALEEPLSPGDFDGFRYIGETLNTQIILDESFLKLADINSISNDPERWIINIRISKMGGLIRSLEIAQRAKELGIGIVIGAQVGETSILTRAALPLANAYRDILIAQEGAFGTYLLERDVVDPPIMFGHGGILSSDRL